MRRTYPKLRLASGPQGSAGNANGSADFGHVQRSIGCRFEYRVETRDHGLLMLSSKGIEGRGRQIDGLKQRLNKALFEIDRLGAD